MFLCEAQPQKHSQNQAIRGILYRMKKRTRRVLLVIAIVAFACISYVVALYAQGYKYSIARGRFERTGAVSIKTNTPATVTIDGQEAGTTSFLGNAFGANRLLPGVYRISAEQPGWTSWQKSAEIREGFVTDFPRVLLVPLSGEDRETFVARASAAFQESVLRPLPPRRSARPTPSPTPLARGPYAFNEQFLVWEHDGASEVIASSAQGFAVPENTGRVLWWTGGELWVLWGSATSYQPLRAPGDRELVTRFSSPILRAAWFPDEDHVLVETGGQWRITEIDTRGGINILRVQ